MWQLGPYTIPSHAVLAPMAGVSDLPFRQLCRQFGAGLAPGEMLTSDSHLWDSRKSRRRLAGLDEEHSPRVVQIAGSEPQMMAEAARACVERGAQIVDINMGCPARKVCNKAAGSALLRDEILVAAILETVVAAVDVPVTLKMRTGWCPSSRNALVIARIAENSGIQALTVHGRTRDCGYHAPAEYDTIAQLVSQVRVPVIANGDIATPEQAKRVLDMTGATAVMIGRAAHGQPWLFRDMHHFLQHGTYLPPLSSERKTGVILQHVRALHAFYGEQTGVRIARKHVRWYAQHLDMDRPWLAAFNQLQYASQQEAAVSALFAQYEMITGSHAACNRDTVEEIAA
ncbi:MAG TPA: tRNA dihydrouridine synthase DusB [Pseudomonadales bacterium]|nr:tRNA dihydrouridine synthase DusB [Pseudomonadales bacterium]